MDDLFPDSLHPRAIGFDAIRYAVPVFFAIYPSAEDRSRVVSWQRRVCRLLASPGFTPQRPELLHISVAACGAPRRQRQPLAEALRLAAERFVCAPFDLTLEATARFGRDGRAFVAVADPAGTRAVHGLRIALADAQKPFGLNGSRAMSEPHLTLGYRDDLPDERRPVEPIRLRVDTVDLIVSWMGRAEHLHLDRWRLTDSSEPTSHADGCH